MSSGGAVLAHWLIQPPTLSMLGIWTMGLRPAMLGVAHAMNSIPLEHLLLRSAPSASLHSVDYLCPTCA